MLFYFMVAFIPSIAFATDYQVLPNSDPAYTMNDWMDPDHGHSTFTDWEATQAPYNFVVGAGGGAVDFNGVTLTLAGLNSIFSQGPSGYTLDLAGHFEDGSSAIDRYVWIVVSKTSENGRKYLFVLTDRTITGDADPRKWGAYHEIWSARYVENPATGIVWPSHSDVIEQVEDSVTAWIVKVEAGLAGQATDHLTTLAKTNCTNVYGASSCNSATWKHVGLRYVVFPTSGGITPASWASGHAGTYYAHHPEDTLSSYDSIGSWLLLSLGGCVSCITDVSCANYCNSIDVTCNGNSGFDCVCTYERDQDNKCHVTSCKAVKPTPDIVADNW
jgi:hypothetical protein